MHTWKTSSKTATEAQTAKDIVNDVYRLLNLFSKISSLFLYVLLRTVHFGAHRSWTSKYQAYVLFNMLEMTHWSMKVLGQPPYRTTEGNYQTKDRVKSIQTETLSGPHISNRILLMSTVHFNRPRCFYSRWDVGNVFYVEGGFFFLRLKVFCRVSESLWLYCCLSAWH
jgi:hypothetical protein